ncbi:hypothetical protein OH799_23290 [Nocardia sp. NBC_00881]|uniref:hypothetical protein n=1 Tax=Nocardia sp. NBC_00881 TaxID=2975995 RepID=UPI00386BBF0D|nr:hypothetical protein OH799_23290 [Nocardia sp. NBC_00881]
MSSVLILCAAYGRGPLGAAEEYVSPTELIAEAYERLPIEDQLSLKQFTANNEARSQSGRKPSHATLRTREPVSVSEGMKSQMGGEFTLSVPTVEYGNSDILVCSLPNPQPGQLLDLTWETFGTGIERLSRQIKNIGKRLDVDVCFGVNDAGLVMATFLASSRFSRCKIGYLRCSKIRDGLDLDVASYFPETRDAPTIFICGFEVKHADVVGYIARRVRERYPKAELYFAVFGAMTKGRDLKVASFDDLTGAKIMRAAEFEAIFIAATMSPPGIEPPLEFAMTRKRGGCPMSSVNIVPDLAQRIASVVRQMMGEIRPQLIDAALTGRRAGNENLRHSDNFLSDYDLWMHERYKEVLVEHIPSFILRLRGSRSRSHWR